jgi:hypothetical protein
VTIVSLKVNDSATLALTFTGLNILPTVRDNSPKDVSRIIFDALVVTHSHWVISFMNKNTMLVAGKGVTRTRTVGVLVKESILSDRNTFTMLKDFECHLFLPLRWFRATLRIMSCTTNHLGWLLSILRVVGLHKPSDIMAGPGQ